MLSAVSTSINFLKDFDPLTRPTQAVKDWLSDHPTVFKIALIANHLFRAAMMTGFMMALPYSAPVNGLICAAGTLFYRLTVQGYCPYKLDVTSLFGATSIMVAKMRLPSIINGIASKSLVGLAGAFVSVVPLTLYAIYVVVTSEKKCCCAK